VSEPTICPECGDRFELFVQPAVRERMDGRGVLLEVVHDHTDDDACWRASVYEKGSRKSTRGPAPELRRQQGEAGRAAERERRRIQRAERGKGGVT
jgi:hypothetical protein